ncbi:prenyltransferase [Kitasatospora sp. MMS16-BH015]|uniref:tryptophan dimethylallyltransferase family protein n=1 Tax=Kitasatospora sp. MMS16-BH015 TaxID=2018025 RepID=UPI000CA0BF9C|nr:tryptophan dimethylallyltransferase family protein [Kitasatospora sp. MMS16-BH015]AUG77611.1 prenyltransferase [Kitasatospora sp. MMS16-BH015]
MIALGRRVPEAPRIPEAHRIPAAPAETLGDHTARQLLRLCEVVGLGPADAIGYVRVVSQALGPVAERPLHLPSPDGSALSDDHTPVEYSLSFEPGAQPTLRVLVEPGCGAGDLARSGREGLRTVRELARRWGFGTERLDLLEDLFFPASPQGPLALWCALELRPGGIPKVKVYLNPAASGPERARATVREAMRRLGHQRAFDALPTADGLLYFALDLGDWDEPRVKVYTAHRDLTAAGTAGLSRMPGGPGAAEVEAFFRTATGAEEGGYGLPDRRPVQACHAFTGPAGGGPSGFTLYVPVRDHARHDGEALERAEALLHRYGIDRAALSDALAAVTSRRLDDGLGLIAYLALARQQGRPPRLMAYLSSEAYRVRPPALPVGAAGR